MGPDSENLLDSDGIEDVLEEAAPPPPVVVVQGRGRAWPWLASVGSVVLLVMVGLLIRDRIEVARLRAQAALARRDMKRVIEVAREEVGELRLAAAVKETNPAPSTPDRTPPPGVAEPAGDPEPPTSPSPAEGGAEGPPPAAPADPVVAPASVPTDAGGPGRAADPVATADAAGRPEAEAPAPALPDGPAAPAVHPAPPESSIVEVATAPLPAAPIATAPAPAAEEPPLPTREETERQLMAEADAIGRENARRAEQQEEDRQAIHFEESRRFLDELRMLLKVHGRRAGPEIQRLSDTAGRTEDPAVLGRARWIILGTRLPQRSKVRRLRELGVPEAVILDYLANEMEQSRGARNGPRSRDEVWYRAGLLLVRYYDDDGARRAPSDPSRKR